MYPCGEKAGTMFSAVTCEKNHRQRAKWTEPGGKATHSSKAVAYRLVYSQNWEEESASTNLGGSGLIPGG